MRKFGFYFAVFIKAALATEIFGGIGLAVYPFEAGFEVVGVVRDAPAEKAGIAVGDKRLAVDGISLAGKSLESGLSFFRGKPGEILNVCILRQNDTLWRKIRREKLIVESAETKGEDSAKNRFLLGRMEFLNLDIAVYMEKESLFSEVGHPLDNALLIFSREGILFYLKEDGLVNISIFHADGKFLKTFNKEGIAGENFEAWSGENLPTGNYFVRLFQKGKTAFYKGTLH